MGGHIAAHWNPDTEDWTVKSATDPNTTYTVRRVRPDGSGERSEAQQKASRGWWWFTLDCSCQHGVDHAPWVVCKHKACVRLWQLHYQRRDGRAWGTLPAHSNAVAQANAAIDPDGVERWKDRQERRGVSGLLDNTDGDAAECPCWPGPVNCPRWRECLCGICWTERSGDLFDGSGNLW